MFGLLKNIKLKICHLKASILKKEIKTTYVWRFIFSHRDISPQKKSVKYTAFLISGIMICLFMIKKFQKIKCLKLEIAL